MNDHTKKRRSSLSNRLNNMKFMKVQEENKHRKNLEYNAKLKIDQSKWVLYPEQIKTIENDKYTIDELKILLRARQSYQQFNPN